MRKSRSFKSRVWEQRIEFNQWVLQMRLYSGWNRNRNGYRLPPLSRGTYRRSDAELQVPELEPRPELESGRLGLQSDEIPWNEDCALDRTPESKSDQIPIPVPAFSSFAAPASFLSLTGAADGK